MQAADFIVFRAALEDERQNLLGRARRQLENHNRGAVVVDVDSASDTADIADATFAAEVAKSLDAAAKDRLYQIERALGKIEISTFGDCEECGQPIDPERLEARPWAGLCMSCQQGLERRAHAPTRLKAA